MPALSVSVDGEHLATVAISGLTMLNIHLYGQRWEEELAILDMHGGNYAGDDKSTYLTWINCRALQAGQIVTVTCVADAQTNSRGRTIDELYPDQPPSEQTDFTPTAAMFEEIGRRPMLRDGYAFKLSTSRGVEYSGRTEADEYGFTLRVLWNSRYRPECARFSVSTITLEQLRTRAPRRDHISGELFLSQSVRFQVWPTS